MFSKIPGHAHVAVEDIILDHIDEKCVAVRGSSATVATKTWLWADGIPTPTNLPPLEDMSKVDVEAMYKKQEARVKVHDDVQSMIDLVKELASATITYAEGDSELEETASEDGQKTELSDEDVPKKKKKKVPKKKSGKPKKYMPYNVFMAANALEAVSFMSLYSSVYALIFCYQPGNTDPCCPNGHAHRNR